jgi:tRNA threonylcarbamoyl adenosine modification protein (Sua5/YciO/YrdC/YwlC family)
VAEAAEALRAGSVVALPTDTVYGLAVDPWQPEAVARLFSLKERPPDVALPVVIGGLDQAGPLTGRLTGSARRLADQYWPGPLTLVVPRAEGFDADLGGPPTARRTVGVRWPDHPLIQALCRELGPLALTSANRHGAPPATTALDVMAAFPGPGDLDVILDGGVCDGVPSTVVECRGTVTRCLREGAIPWTSLSDSDPDGRPSGGG